MVLLYVSSMAFRSTSVEGDTVVLKRLKHSTEAAATKEDTQHGRCTTSTKYISSEFELAWLGNVKTWQDSFCEAISAPQQKHWTNIWLSTIAEERSGKQDIQYDPAVFSRFVTTRSCPGKQKPEQITTWIEPLAHGLRHPHALCSNITDIFDRGYLLLANGSDALALHAAASKSSVPRSSSECHGRGCQALYLDLGATRWEADKNSVGQAWFYR
jgi:hypothetical protein